eukprot:SM000131S26686  [mRNA]  locus=s131:52134:54931:+ [translate_table: standard]
MVERVEAALALISNFHHRPLGASRPTPSVTLQRLNTSVQDEFVAMRRQLKDLELLSAEQDSLEECDLVETELRSCRGQYGSLRVKLRNANLQAHANEALLAKQEATQAGMVDTAESVTDSLRRTRQLMAQEVARGGQTLAVMAESHHTLQKADEEYKGQRTLLKTTRRLLSVLQRQDVLDRLILVAGLLFFLLVCFYILNKRLGLVRSARLLLQQQQKQEAPAAAEVHVYARQPAAVDANMGRKGQQKREAAEALGLQEPPLLLSTAVDAEACKERLQDQEVAAAQDLQVQQQQQKQEAPAAAELHVCAPQLAAVDAIMGRQGQQKREAAEALVLQEPPLLLSIAVDAEVCEERLQDREVAAAQDLQVQQQQQKEEAPAAAELQAFAPPPAAVDANLGRKGQQKHEAAAGLGLQDLPVLVSTAVDAEVCEERLQDREVAAAQDLQVQPPPALAAEAQVGEEDALLPAGRAQEQRLREMGREVKGGEERPPAAESGRRGVSLNLHDEL